MEIFVTGATGFFGGFVAFRLKRSGFEIRGLARSEDRAAALLAMGIQPVMGLLSDTALLTSEAKAADAVVNTADADDESAARTLIAALSGTRKTLIHTS